MENVPKTCDQLLRENEGLRSRLAEAESTLEAIRRGHVDALVVNGPEGDLIFSLATAEQQYRVLVETMNEGAAMLSAQGTIYYCNGRLAYMLRYPIEHFMGRLFHDLVESEFRQTFASLLAKGIQEPGRAELVLVGRGDKLIPAYVSCAPIPLPGEKGVACVITDLTEQKQSLALRSQELEQHSLDRFSMSMAGSVIAKFYDRTPLKEAMPEAFEELVARYAEVLELSLEQRVLKVDHRVPSLLQRLAEDMGVLKFGPNDVVEIHRMALRTLSQKSRTAQTGSYREEARFILVGIMGNLISFYRNHYLGFMRTKKTYESES